MRVSDFSRSKKFNVEGLGWRASAKSSSENIVFIDAGGVVLGLYPRDLLAEDATLKPGTGFGGVTLAQNVGSKAEVDAALAAAVDAGASLLKSAADTFWGGYSGYSADRSAVDEDACALDVLHAATSLGRQCCWIQT